MRRLVNWLLPAALLIALCGRTFAAEQAELVRTFVYENTLYTYVEYGGDRPVTKASAEIGGQTFPADRRLETVRQAGSPVRCLLLVDCSTSMPPFSKEITAFAEALAAEAGENARYTVATLGDGFGLLAEDLTAEELPAAVASIPYKARVTRLHTAIGGALDYFEGLPRERNELRSLVVLTDAVQYDPSGGIPYEELLERMGESDVLLHSVGFGKDTASLERLAKLVEASQGLHWEAAETAAADAAKALSDYTGALLVTGFDISGCTSSGEDREVSVTFGSGADLLCRARAKTDIPALEGVAPTPAEPSKPVPPPSGGNGGGESGSSGNNEAGSGGGSAAPAEPAPQSPAEQPEKAGGAPVVPIVVGVIAAAAILALVLLKRKKPEAPAAASIPAPPAPEVPHPEPPPAETPQSGVYMRLEVLRGTYTGAAQEFQLADELPVGGDEGCPIRFADEGASPKHARVFLQGGAVWAEPLEGEISVNGAAIDGPRRLRSGDEISVGPAAFKLKF